MDVLYSYCIVTTATRTSVPTYHKYEEVTSIGKEGREIRNTLFEWYTSGLNSSVLNTRWRNSSVIKYVINFRRTLIKDNGG